MTCVLNRLRSEVGSRAEHAEGPSVRLLWLGTLPLYIFMLLFFEIVHSDRRINIVCMMPASYNETYRLDRPHVRT